MSLKSIITKYQKYIYLEIKYARKWLNTCDL